MSKIEHIGRFSNETTRYFGNSIFDAYFENVDEDALSIQKLFDITLTQELPRDYTEILAQELRKLDLEIDHTGKTGPISCQNVPCHRDMIIGSPRSIVANVGKQTGRLLIHQDLNGKIIDSVELTQGDIFTFDHHQNWHSVLYTGNPQSFMMIVRASVTNIL
ncbi:hypothetical protein HOO68_04235 [Candidatus Gracilibacteria bacterium]|nr:hypothetical protein [Candidatus Gracilibacteria bacterium]